SWSERALSPDSPTRQLVASRILYIDLRSASGRHPLGANLVIALLECEVADRACSRVKHDLCVHAFDSKLSLTDGKQPSRALAANLQGKTAIFADSDLREPLVGLVAPDISFELTAPDAHAGFRRDGSNHRCRFCLLLGPRIHGHDVPSCWIAPHLKPGE